MAKRITELECALYGTKEPFGRLTPRGVMRADPRPTITAWQGADLDAYWWDGAQWLHCRTGEVWHDDQA